MFFAWNAAGLVIYKMINETKTRTLTDEEKTGLSKGRFRSKYPQWFTSVLSGQQLALEMGKTNAKIISLTNFNVEVKDPIIR